MKNFVVDKDLCIGCGLCADICPEVFVLDDDGKAESVKKYDKSFLEDAEEAMDSCPTNAISNE